MIFVIVLSLAGGGVIVWFATESKYKAKLNSIRSEVRLWEGHSVSEVRTLVARVKAFL